MMKKTLASLSVVLVALTAVSAASAATNKYKRVTHETYSTAVTDGHQVLGMDPDVNIRASLTREGIVGAAAGGN
jgi:hypothetical protein